MLQDLLRLQRAEQDAPGWKSIAEVRSHLEDALGRTVPRSVAARTLGVSQPALDKWIARGDVPTVLTPEGRTMVPVREVLDLAEALEAREKRLPGEPYPLAAVLHERRARVEQLDPETILPQRYRRHIEVFGHRRAELRSLAYHRALAQRLDPRAIRDARLRLDRWRGEGKIHGLYAERWEKLLSRPIDQIARSISRDTPAARDLRQNSPLMGVLREPERRRVLELV